MLNIKIIERELYSNCEALNSLSKHHLKYWLSSGVKKRVEGWVYIAKIKATYCCFLLFVLTHFI